MQAAFGTFEIRAIDTLRDDAADRRVREVMENRGLTEYIRSDGSSYPIVRRADRGVKVKRFEVLDPYFAYARSCLAVTTETVLQDGWKIHIERQMTLCDTCRGQGCDFCEQTGEIQTPAMTPSCA